LTRAATPRQLVASWVAQKKIQIGDDAAEIWRLHLKTVYAQIGQMAVGWF
jgi:hypothetical protein